MVPKVRMRQSRSYGRSLQNFPPPKSGVGCDICGRRIAASVPDPSTGARTPLKPFEMAIGVGGEKRLRQSRQSEHFIRDCRDTPYPDLPGVKVGWKENGEPKRTTAADLGQGKRNRSYLCGPATIQSRRSLGSSAARNNQFASALRAGRSALELRMDGPYDGCSKRCMSAIAGFS